MDIRIKGKQLEDASIQTSKINISTSSIVNPNDVTNKEYVDTAIAEKAMLYYSKLNLNMVANVTTGVNQRASNEQVIEFPISNVLVKLNGFLLDVGETKDCYFSPDGITKRVGGLAQKGDYLYWNSTKFNLDATDEIDFIYLVGYYYINAGSGTTETLNPIYNTLVVKYNGDSGTSMNVIISGHTYLAGNVGGNFVWDIGGLDEHTFTYATESIVVTIDGQNYTIWFDGFGSLIFSIKKGGEIVIQLFNIQAGLNGMGYAVEYTQAGNFLLGGNFTSYRGKVYNNIVQVDQNGNTGATFSSGDGFNSTAYHINRTSSGKYLTQGLYTTYSGQTVNNFALLNSNGTLDKSYVQSYPISLTDATKRAYCSLPDDLIVGGRFTATPTLYSKIIKLNSDGSVDSGFTIGTGFNTGNVYAIKNQSDGKLVIGGTFTSYSGVTSNRIIRLNSNGTIDSGFTIGTGFAGGTTAINSIDIQSDGKIIVGGYFTSYSGVSANGIIRLNSDGSRDTGFTIGTGFGGATPYVYAVKIQSDGKILCGGYFNSYSGVTSNNIIRLNSDGTKDTGFTIGVGFTTGTGYVRTIETQSDGKILVGGAFPSYSGVTANNIIRLNSNGTRDTGFTIGTGFDSNVYAIDIKSDGKILVGGAFSNYNGVSYSKMILLNADGTVDTSFANNLGFSINYVLSIKNQLDNKILVGGYFTGYDGVTANNIIRLNADGSRDTGFTIGLGFDTYVNTILLQSDNKMIIGGSFSSYDAMIYQSLIKFNTDGSIDKNFYNSSLFVAAFYVYDMVKNDDNSMLLAGDFTYTDPSINRIIQLNTDGTKYTGFTIGTGFNSTVVDQKELSDGKIAIAGSFSNYNLYSNNRINILNADGTVYTGFTTGTGFNNPIYGIAVQSDNKILIAGAFTSFNGYSQSGITRLNTDGSRDSGFSNNVGFNNNTQTIELQPDNKILVGGYFTTYSGITYNKIIRLNSNGTIDTGFTIGAGIAGTNPYVYAIKYQSDGKIVVGGIFTSYSGISNYASSTVNYLTKINNDFTINSGFTTGTGFNGSVYVSKKQTDGKLVVGGNFTTYNGISANRLVRLNTDGSIDTGFTVSTGFNATVNDIDFQSDGKILVGGTFTSYSGLSYYGATPASRIVCLNSNGTINTGFSYGTGLNGIPHVQRATPDGKILVGGVFTTYSGITQSQLVKLNLDGTIDSGFTYGGFTSTYGIRALAFQADGKILVAGNIGSYSGLTAYGSTTANYIAKLNSNADINTGFTVGTGFNAYVNCYKEQTDGKILVGGRFTAYSGITQNYITRLLASGVIDSGFTIGTGFAGGTSEIKTIDTQSDGKIIVGGTFTSYSGISTYGATTSNYITKLNLDGSINTGFTIGTGFSGTVYSHKEQTDGKILVGGVFIMYNGAYVSGITRLNANGSLDTGFNVGGYGLSAARHADVIEIQSDGKILAGGLLSNYNGGGNNSGMIRLNVDGTLDTGVTFIFTADRVVSTIQIQTDGKILAGGEFTTYSGVTQNYITRLNPDGTRDTGFTIGVGFNSSGFVNSICLQPDGKILAGGEFTTYSGVTQNRITRLLSNGTIDSGFTNGGFNQKVYVIKIQSDNKIMVGGQFTQYSGVTANYVVRLNSDGTRDTGFTAATFSSPSTTDVRTITVLSDGKYLVGGNFTSYNGITNNYLIKLNSDGTRDNTFDIQIGFNGRVLTTSKLSDDSLIVGGSFTTFGGSKPNYLVRLNTDGTLDTTFKLGNGYSAAINKVKVLSDNKILVGGTFTSFNGSISNYFNKLNADGSLDATVTTGVGFNAYVSCIETLSNNKIVLGGNFTTYSGSTMNRIIRLNTDCTIDTGFTIGAGLSHFAQDIKVQTGDKVLVGGLFTTYSGISSAYLVRLNTDGSKDLTFNSGLTGIGGGQVNSIFIQTDGSILVGGQFGTYNTMTANGIIKLTSNGAIDRTFNTRLGFNTVVVYTTIQTSDSDVLVGGGFTFYGASNIKCLVRLNSNGTLDTSFRVGSSFTASTPIIYDVKVQTDGKIVCVGNMATFNGESRTYIARLNSDGTRDTGFNTEGTGFNDDIYALDIQSDGKLLCGGYFGAYNGVAVRFNCRLNVDGSRDTTYNSNYSSASSQEIHKILQLPDGNILIGNRGLLISNSGGTITKTLIASALYVYDMALQTDGKILACGTINVAPTGEPLGSIVRFNSDYTLDTGFTTGIGVIWNKHSYSITQLPNGNIMFGGEWLEYGGSNTRYFVRLNTNGTLDTSAYLGFNFSTAVQSIKVLSDESILVGGGFTGYDNILKNYIIKLNSNLSLNTGFTIGTGFNGIVRNTTVQPDNSIIVSGDFTSYNGVTQNRITRLNSDGSRDSGFTIGTGFNSAVYSNILQTDGKIIVGGNFTTYSGITQNYITRLLSNGTRDSGFTIGNGFNALVNSVGTQADGKILVGGSFTTYTNNTLQNYFTRLNSDGTLDSTIQTTVETNAVVRYILPLSDGVIIGGDFTTYGGNNTNSLIRLNSDGTIDTGFTIGNGFNSTVRSIFIQTDNKILVGGAFTQANGVFSSGLTRLNSDGSIDTGFTVGTGFNTTATIYDIKQQSDGKILAGGIYTSYSGITANRLIRLNSDGTKDTGFNIGAGFNNAVNSVEILSTGRILVGGGFTSYDSLNSNYLLRLNSDCTVSTDRSIAKPGTFNALLYALKKDSIGRILCVGAFTTYNGTSSTRIIRLNSDYTIDSGFTSGAGLNALTTGATINIQTDGKIILGGSFTSYSGITQNYITRLNDDGTLDTGFTIGTGFDTPLSKVKLLSTGKILCAGNFTSYNGTTIHGLARLNADGTLDTSFVSNFTSPLLYDVAVDDTNNKYSVVGSFSRYYATSANKIVSINNVDGKVDLTFISGSGFDTYITCFKKQPDGKFLVGGNFSYYNGISSNRFIRLNSDGTRDTNFNIGTGFSGGDVNAIEIQPDGKILLGGVFLSYSGVTQNRITRLLSDGTRDTGFTIGTGSGSAFNSTVFDIELQSDGKILYGGNFTTYSGASAPYIARLNSNGSLDTGFTIGTGFNNVVYSMSNLSDGKILVGGQFTTYSGITTPCIARLNSNGSLDTGFTIGTGFNNYVYSVKVQSNGKILVGGGFTTYSGITQNYITRLNSDGSLDTGFVTGTGFNGFVRNISITPDNQILCLGNFSSYNGAEYNNMILLNMDGSVATTTTP